MRPARSSRGGAEKRRRLYEIDSQNDGDRLIQENESSSEFESWVSISIELIRKEICICSRFLVSFSPKDSSLDTFTGSD